LKATTRTRTAGSRGTGTKAGAGGSRLRQKAQGRVELVRDGRDLRLFIHLLGVLVHRLDYERRQVYSDDLEMAYVAGTVGLEATDASFRRPEFREAYRNIHNIIGVAGQRGVNALSVAQATGIPRETVRRKLKLLVEHGALVEKSPGNYVVKPGFMQAPRNLAIYEKAVQYTMQFINECVAHGLIQWTTEPEDDPSR
jgi:hypothetical protein